MHFLNKIVPPFLKKLDHYLLLNHRLIWETKFHFVLFYGLTAFIAYTLLGLVYPISLTSALPDPLTVGIVGAIPVFILFCYWAYHQIQYAIEANYGQLFAGLGQWRMLIYFTSTLIFILPATQLGFLVNQRIADLTHGKELDEDILTLNIGNPFYLVNGYYSGDHDIWYESTVNILEYLDCKDQRSDQYCDRFDFEYFGSTYGDIYSYYGGMDDRHLIFNLKSYFKYDTGLHREEKINYISAYKQVFEKYGGVIHTSPIEVYQGFYKDEQVVSQLGYQKYFVKNQIKSIAKAQAGVDNFTMRGVTKVSLILAFMFSLVMYTLKSVSMKDFIISIVSLAGVGIGTIATIKLWTELVGYTVLEDTTFFVLLSTGIILFTISRVTSINYAKSYSRFLTICLVALNLVGPFLLLWSTVSLDMIGHYNFFRDADSVWNVILAGVLLHAVVTLPWLREKFLRLKSLPKA
ncbi:MAG: hypothetical protein ACPGJS_12780 [Flammeovirgaceae bacterium]